jgi:hypothetical protein
MEGKMAITQIITTEVYRGEKEVELKVVFEDDVVTFFLDKREVFRGDWTNNFFELFCRAVGNWKRID